MTVSEYSLRERKHAQTRIAILKAFIGALETSRFDDISVRSICKAVDISEGTFFNYFSEKLDILNYHSQMFFIKGVWQTKREADEDDFTAFIERLFYNLSKNIVNPNILYKMIAVMVVQKERPKKFDIPEIEKKMLFPDCPGIENISFSLPDAYFKTYVERLFKAGLLPSGIKSEDLVVSLNTILIGTMLAVKFQNTDREYHYLRQLRLLWKGLGIKNLSARNK